MLRVLIADNHAIVRRGLKGILCEDVGSVVVDEASNGQEALEKARAGQYDVVVLDITMPHQSGLQVLEKLKQEQPGLPVLILSMHTDHQYVTRILKAGASGYLSKERAPAELATAIRTILNGETYTSRSRSEGPSGD